jgi:RHS repeat-associated protein
MNSRIPRPLQRITPHAALWALALMITILPISARAQKAYIPNFTDGTVSVINTATNLLCTTSTCVSSATYPLSVGTSPRSVAVTPDGGMVYVGNIGSNTISVISTATDTVTATITVSGPPISMAILPNGSAVYALTNISGSPYLSVISTSSNTVTTTIPLTYSGGSPIPEVVVAAPDSSHVYVVTQQGGEGGPRSVVLVISTASNTQTAIITGGGPHIIFVNAIALAVSPDSSTLYVTDSYGVEIVSLSAGAITSTISMSNAGRIVVSPDGSTAYVTGLSLSTSVSVVNLASGTITSTITVGSNPVGMSFSHDANMLYVTNAASNSVSVISTTTYSVLTTVTVGNDPLAIGVFIQPPPPMSGEQLGPNGCGCNAADAATTVTSLGAVSAGEPIDIGSGNMSYKVTDYATAGQNPFAFTRYHNSRANTSGLSTFATSLGVNWRSNYDRYIRIVSSSSVIVEQATGRQYGFMLTGSTWTANSDVDLTLTHSGSTWTLTDQDDTVQTFTTTTAGNEALLNSIASRNGYTQTLTYNTSNQLTGISDSYSRSFSLTYNTDGTLHTVTTPDSTAITYGYNTVTAGKQLASVTYPTSPSTSQTYLYANSSLPFALTGITDENGNSYATWTYDALARGLTSQQGSGANLTTLVYNSNGTTSVTNPLGVTDTYTFTTLQGVPKVTGISRAATSTTAAATESFTYDSNGYRASLTDWNGNITNYTNNSHGLPTQTVEAYGSTVARTTTIAYDTTWVHLPDTITTPGRTIGFTYDGSGNVLTRTLTDTTTSTIPYSTGGQTRTTTWTYSNHLLASAKTPNGNITSYGYDSSGALTSITDPLSHVTHITSHTGGGLPLTVVDPNSVTTTLTYTPRQWLLTSSVSTGAGARTTTYTYDAAGNLTKTTLPDSSYISNAYDAAHRVTSSTDALGNYINYTLNALGNHTQENTYTSGATLKKQHSATFDALGRLLVDTAGAGQTTTYTYDKNSNILTVQDGNSHTTTYTYDALNRQKNQTNALSGVTQYVYDPHDKLTSLTDPNGHATTWVRDGFSEAIQEVSPDRGTTVYHFDSDGNLTQKVDAASNTMNQTFDALDRTLTTTYPADSTLNVAYTYDQTGTGFTFGIGRLTSLTDQAGSLTRAYDERGNLLTEKRTSGTTVLTTGYTYDPASRTATITYPSGTLVTNTRDAVGRVTTVAAKAPGAGSATNLATSITYVPFGPMTGASIFNGVSLGYTLDQAYRITATDGISHTNYNYDNADNLTSTSDWTYANGTQTLSYDALNRLTYAYAIWGYGTFTYTYDANGNRLSENDRLYTYASGTNRLTGISWTDPTYGPITNVMSYTPTGNANDIYINSYYHQHTTTYNAANRLATVSNVLLGWSNTYDAFGKRIIKTPPTGGPTYFSYDRSANMLEEEQSGSLFTDYIYLNGKLIGLEESTGSGAALYYVGIDSLGTPRFVTDSSNSIVWASYFFPFGYEDGIGGSITQSVRFPGQYGDDDLEGYLYNLNRNYFASWGRYFEADPLGMAAGTNPYLYANANPISHVDPSGLITAVVINRNGAGHAGVYVSNGGDGTSLIFDPYGSYNPSANAPATVSNDLRDSLYPPRGSDGTISGGNLQDYINYQKLDGPNVQVSNFDTTPQQETDIANQARQTGEPWPWGPNNCTTSTSSALSGVGPFKNLGTYYLPTSLGDAVRSVR